MKKRLYRSKDNVMVAGVLAGIAEYFDHDPTLWRLAFVLLLIATGVAPGVIVYIAGWIIIPVTPDYTYTEVKTEPSE